MDSPERLCLRCCKPLIWRRGAWDCDRCQRSFTEAVLAVYEPGSWAAGLTGEPMAGDKLKMSGAPYPAGVDDI